MSCPRCRALLIRGYCLNCGDIEPPLDPDVVQVLRDDVAYHERAEWILREWTTHERMPATWKQRFRTPAPRGKPKFRTPCQICGEQGVARRLCSKHYWRWRRTGDPFKGRDGYSEQPIPLSVAGIMQERKRTPICRICGLPTLARALWPKHYMRLRRHGDPLKTLYRMKGDE